VIIFYRFVGYTFTSFLVLVGRIDWMNEDLSFGWCTSMVLGVISLGGLYRSIADLVKITALSQWFLM
jgi:hypothetical protein